MKYFIDMEFQEGFHKPLFGKRRHFIDLISIAIVDENERSYYAVCKEFDLKGIWYSKDWWLKENVIKAIYLDLLLKESGYVKSMHPHLVDWNYRGVKNLIYWHGKSKARIVSEITKFICPYSQAVMYSTQNPADPTEGLENYLKHHPIEFYGYYADYDWVLFCSLFGRMIDLPKGFPMWCRDLKQMKEDLVENMTTNWERFQYRSRPTKLGAEKFIESNLRQENEHHALADAMYNLALYKRIKTLAL